MSSDSRTIFPAAVQQAGSSNFDPSSAVYDFTDTFSALDANQYVVLTSYYYNAPASAAHDFDLWQGATPNATPSDAWGVLEARTGITSVSNSCEVKIHKANNTTSWVLIARTANGKDAAGTLSISYLVRSTT